MKKQSENVQVDVSGGSREVNNVVTGIINQALEISGFSESTLLTPDAGATEEDVAAINEAAQKFQEHFSSSGESVPEFFPHTTDDDEDAPGFLIEIISSYQEE